MTRGPSDSCGLKGKQTQVVDVSRERASEKLSNPHHVQDKEVVFCFPAAERPVGQVPKPGRGAADRARVPWYLLLY